MPAINPRKIAIDTLALNEQRKEPVDRIFNDLVCLEDFDSKDKNLAMAIIYGVLRHKLEIEAIISHYATQSISQMKQRVRMALCVGLYQLLFMDRIPSSAAVNETINGFGSKPKHLKGFINGLLRNVGRHLPETQQLLQELPSAIKRNHPHWLQKSWENDFGPDKTKEICENNNHPAPLSIRVNCKLTSTKKLLTEFTNNNLNAQPGQLVADAILLTDFRGPMDIIPGFNQGLFHVQDQGAQLISQLLAPFPRGKYLDACAGLGGKTITMDQLLPPEATITALDPSTSRLSLLKDNINRCQCRPIEIINDDIQHHQQNSNVCYDAILIDAPCSGLGVIRRQPDIRWHRTKKHINLAAEKQIEIINAASQLIKPNGLLIYATCSISKIENELVIADFLKNHPNFKITTPTNCQNLKHLLNNDGFLAILPGPEIDGFFGVQLTRIS